MGVLQALAVHISAAHLFQDTIASRKHILQELVSTVFLLQLDHRGLSHVMGSKAL